MALTRHIPPNKRYLVPLVIGIVLGICGPVFFAIVGFISTRPPPEPSSRSITGKVGCPNTVDAALVGEVCYAEVIVRTHTGGKNGRYIELLNESAGEKLSLQTTEGRIDFTTPTREYGLEHSWIGCRSTTKKTKDVSAMPVAQGAEPGRSNYMVLVWSLQRDQLVTIDTDEAGKPVTLWCGEPKAVNAEVRSKNSDQKLEFAGLALGSLVLGLLAFAGARALRP